MPFPSPKRPSFPRTLAATLAVLGSALLPLAAQAEDAADSPLRSGAWAAEFELDPSYRYDFGFTSGVTISAKRHHSARSALRFGASIAFNESEDKGEASYERYYYYSNPTFSSKRGTTERHSENHGYTLFLHLQRYHSVRDAMSIFWELGPSLRYNESDYSSEYIYPFDFFAPGEINRDSRSLVARSAALDLGLGFEWFFNRRLSLGARGGAWWGYSWGTESSSYETYTTDNSYYRVGRDRNDLKRVTFQTSPATVTFSAYF
ncbi:MAG: hypothetical protein AABZ94_02170 [Candidatus Eisenbacteria bacterium]